MDESLKNRVAACLARVERGAGGAELLAALRELDEIAAGRKSELPSDLAHYLEKRSYAKAAAWLKYPDLKHER